MASLKNLIRVAANKKAPGKKLRQALSHQFGFSDFEICRAIDELMTDGIVRYDEKGRLVDTPAEE